MRTGVALHLGTEPGELFADARALESAGADSLWVIARDDQDPWTLAAALAAVTWRAFLVMVDAPEHAGARATVEALSRGRLRVAERDGQALLVALEGDAERWMQVDFPKGRAAWKELRTAREAEGFSGLVVPSDPRLLDLLRNPDTEDDRSDLHQAVG